ncbi:MAG: Sapep family Mn(2+)-dependent dipeptidase [Eubacteriales bacterium]
MDKQTNIIIEHLRKLVSIKSVSGEASGEYPFGEGPYEALEYVLDLCKSYGFKTKQCGNACGYAEIGQGEEIFGVLVHLDVVPAGEGWTTNPYDVTVVDGKLFGRGVIDDKGPAVAVIHAMKELLDNKVLLNKRIRIIFGTSEETGDEEDLRLYKEYEELPTMGFTPDADFPVVYLEKGIAEIELSMKLEDSGLVNADGGMAVNMVPDACTLSYMKNGKEYTVEATGKSAHGSMPWLGENAIGNAVFMICSEDDKEVIPFAKFYSTCIGMHTDGVGLGCDFTDEQSGGTTVNPGLIEIRDHQVVVTLDIRCAVSCTPELLMTSVKNIVEPYGVKAELTDWCESVYMDKDGEFVQTLMSVYREVTEEETEPLIMGGGTYARSMEHIVAFGPTFPGRECTEHQPNEYIYLKDLLKGKEIYYEAMKRICS